MKLYEKVKLYRISNGFKQAFIAKKSGMSEKKLSAIETGRQRLTTDDFEVICRLGFMVNPGIFFESTFLESKNVTVNNNPNPAA